MSALTIGYGQTCLFLRTLVTITDNSLAGGYGIDEHGGCLHDLLGTRYDPYVNRMLTGEDFHHLSLEPGSCSFYPTA